MNKLKKNNIKQEVNKLYKKLIFNNLRIIKIIKIITAIRIRTKQAGNTKGKKKL